MIVGVDLLQARDLVRYCSIRVLAMVVSYKDLLD